MKTLLVCIVVVTCLSAEAQTSTDSLYVVTYSLGSGWDPAKKPNEQLYFKEHSAHLSSLRKSGVIKFGARYADKGMIFISAVSLENAREIINSDVAIQYNLFTTDIRRMNVFYPYKE